MKTYLLYPFSISCICIFVLFIGQAYAYIDPATGSMIVQAVIAAIAAASVTIGIFWRRVKSFLGKVFGRNDGTRN